MKKNLITTSICIFLLATTHAQKISESEARQYLEKVWSYLKTSDSTAFVNLWLPEDSAWQNLYTPAEDYMKSFHFLRRWLEPALSKNLDINRIEVGQESAKGIEIKAFFKARERASIGFTFYVAQVNGKWTARGKPGYFAGPN